MHRPWPVFPILRRALIWRSLTGFLGLLLFSSVGTDGAPIITATKDDNLAAGLRKVPGNTITYTTTISNTGDATATGVQFTDPDPANTAFVSVNSTASAPLSTHS